jgi:phosphoenolpyruvate---glycerone phosphotransferase subunit DhaK
MKKFVDDVERMLEESLRDRFKPAGEIVEELLGVILGELKPSQGSELLLHVNGFGGTPPMELCLLFHCAAERLRREGLQVSRSLVGNYTTSLEMAGGSLTVTTLDDETKALWDAPVDTAALRW